MGRLGPTRLRLADIADELGIVPATLSQRYGSKRGLLLALAKLGTDSIAEHYEAARRRSDSAIGALVDSCTSAAELYYGTPEEFSNHLAFLQIDLNDAEFHAAALEQSEAIRAGMKTLLDEAVDAREIAPCDTTQLASVVHAVWNGSLLNWAVHRQGTAADCVRQDLALLLGLSMSQT